MTYQEIPQHNFTPDQEVARNEFDRAWANLYNYTAVQAKPPYGEDSEWPFSGREFLELCERCIDVTVRLYRLGCRTDYDVECAGQAMSQAYLNFSKCFSEFRRFSVRDQSGTSIAGSWATGSRLAVLMKLSNLHSLLEVKYMCVRGGDSIAFMRSKFFDECEVRSLYQARVLPDVAEYLQANPQILQA